MSHIHIAKTIYLKLMEIKQDGKIPVTLRPLSTVGTVQDDPFDEWFGELLAKSLPEFEVVHSGPLTTPDIIIRDKKTREVIGIEVKKVDESVTGKDSRGLTLDYNSCIPCGQMQIKIGGQVSKIKTYYFFGLLSYDKSHLVTSCLVDGDFLNYDFDLHLQGKYLNTSQYGHGPYGEGSVRGRAMYLYPNPMNVDIPTFYKKHSFVIKDEFIYQIDDSSLFATAKIKRADINKQTFGYTQFCDEFTNTVSEIADIFSKCKARKQKKRQAYLTEIDDAPAAYMPQQSGPF